MFKTIDRYILREIVVPFAIGLVVLTFVLVIPIVLKHGEQLIAQGVGFSTILRVIFTLLPSQLSLTIPMSVLLGILIGFGRLSADREFVALQACGVSLMRLLRPILLFSLAAMAFAGYQTIVALPAANQTFREIAYSEVVSQVEGTVKPQVLFQLFPNRTIYVQDLPAAGGWRNVFLADTTVAGRTTNYFARQGRIRLDREQRIVQLELVDVVAHTFYPAKPDQYDEDKFESFLVTLDPNTVFPPPPEKGAPEMTFAELDKAIAAANARRDPGYNFRFMVQQKLSLPATCPILAIIALALGASNRKDGKLANFVLGFAVVFVYYILLYVFRALAMGGRFNPEWAPWVPNIVMAVAGVLLLVWRSRSADQPIRLTLPAFWRRGATDAPAVAPKPASPSSRRVVLVIRLPHLNLPSPRLLDFYLARQYWRVAAICLISLLGLSYIAQFIDVADELFRKEATVGVVVRYFYFQTPQLVFYGIPMSVLVATLVTTAVMTKNSELIVMRACGISLYRTAVPLVIFGVLAAGALFLIQEQVLPMANREADRLNRIIRGYPPPIAPFNQRWIVGRNGTIYRYDLFDSTTNRFVNLWAYRLSPEAWRLDDVTFVQDAALARPGAEDNPDFSVWKGRQGWIRRLPGAPAEKAAPRKADYERFPERELLLESPDYFMSRPMETEQMSYDQMLSFNELRHYINQLRASGSHVVPFVVALHRKIAFPLVTVIMTLLALPFGVGGGRKGALYGLGVGIVLAIAYFVTMSVFGALGSGGFLSPVLAAWAANMLFGAAAIYMILTVRT